MITVAEKLKMINEYNQIASKIAVRSMISIKDNNIISIIKDAKELKQAQKNIFDMYMNEIIEAINPSSAFSMPMLIAALEITTETMEKLHPEALDMAKTFKEDMSISTNSFSMKNTKERNI